MHIYINFKNKKYTFFFYLITIFIDFVNILSWKEPPRIESNS